MKLCKKIIAGLTSIALLPGATGTPLAQTLLSIQQASVSAAADWVGTAGEWQYEVIHETITITGYTGKAADVAIPAEIEELPVTSIGAQALYGCFSIRTITIPDSVTSVGENAFCQTMTRIKENDFVMIDGWIVAYTGESETTAVIPDTARGMVDSLFYQDRFTI